MKLRLPFCPPFIHTAEGQTRLGRVLLRLPFVDSVSMPVFSRREILRCYGDHEEWNIP
jgi:hypothetical protein